MLRRTGLALLLFALILVAFLAFRTHTVLSEATSLDLTPDSGNATAGTPFTVTVTAYDNESNVDTTYVGTVHFTSSDSAAILPADYTFQSADNGTHAFTDGVTLRTADSQTITITDGAALTDTANWTVSPASAARLDVTGTGSMSAGDTNELTVTAKDSYGNTDTSYAGSKSLTFSGPAAAPAGQIPTVESVAVGSSTTVVFTSGISNAGAATLIAYRAESTTVDVSDGTINSSGSAGYDLDLTVSAASAIRLEVTGTGSMTAGAANELTITAKDSYGNTAASYTGSKVLVFSGPANAPGGQIPTVESVSIGSSTTVAFGSGVSNAGAATLVAYRAEATTVDVSDGTINSFGSTAYDLDLTVGAASAARLEVAGTGSMTAGATNELTITAWDSYSNAATSYAGSKSLVFSGPAPAPAGQVPTVESVSIGSATTVAFTSGTSNAGITTLIAYRAESTTVDVSDGTINSFGSTAYDLDLTVTPAAAARLEVTGSATMIAGAANELTVTAKDTFGNTDPSYAGSKSLTFSGPAAAPAGQIPTVESVNIGSTTTVAFTSGTSNAGAATLIAYRAETTVVDVSDGAIDSFGTAAYDLDLTVTATSAASLDLTPNGGSTSAGSPFTVTVTAYDIYSNVATGYLGTVHFSSSDPSAGLPSDHAFESSDNGVHTFAITLLTSGNQTIAVTDTVSPTLTNTETWTVGVATIHHYTVTSGSYSQIAGTPFVATVTAYDSFGNVVTADNSTSVTMSSNSPTMLFDGNNNGIFDEAGDNVTVLLSGTFNITARDTTTGTTATITATDGGAKTGTSSAYTITSAAIDHYTVASASYSQTAGMSFVVTVTAYDSFGNLASSENATSVTMTSTSATMLFDSNSNGVFGEASDNVTALSPLSSTFNITARETVAATGATITATDVNSKTGISGAYAITATVIDHYTVISASYAQTAGVPFVVTVSAYDSFGNLVNYDNTTSVTMTSNSATMLFDSNSNGAFGEASDNVMVLLSGTFNISARDTTAGTTATVTATDANSKTGTSAAYTVTTAAAIDHYTVTSTSYIQTAGVPFIVTVAAYDSFGNLISTDNYTSVTMTSNSATMLFDGNNNGTFGESDDNVTVLSFGTFSISARDTTAGTTATITGTDNNSTTGTSSAYTVNPAPVDRYTVTSASYAQIAGAPFMVTVTAYDAFGNLVNTDNSTSVTVTSNSVTMLFDSNSNGIFGESGDDITALSSGTFNISTRDTTAGTTATVTATDGNSKTGTSSAYSVSAEGTIDHYNLASTTYIQRAGVPFSVTVTAHDRFHNRVDDNSTLVTMTSTSATMLFDSNNNSIFGEAGDNVTVLSSGTFSISARDTTAGTSATITATDANSKTGSSVTYSIIAGAIDHYAVTSDGYTQQVTVSFTVTVTAYDVYGNLVNADNVTLTLSSTLPTLTFDGNGNGIYGETGDNSGTLTAGTVDIPAKAASAADGIVITATDTNAKTGTSEPYSFGDFRCFIATAAYGTPMVDQIQVLRDFRDRYLMTSPAGRVFVSTYYRCSPPVARFIAHHDSLRAVVRVVLTPVIWLTTLVMNTTTLQKVAILIAMVAELSAAALWLDGRRRAPAP